MLDRAHRLTRAVDFSTAVRRGRRAGSRTLVTHLWFPSSPSDPSAPARVGFVVSRSVGDAVTRNRVKRRLRHLLRARLAALPAGSLLVVRALPASGSATTALLAEDLDRTLARVGTAQEATR